MLTFHTLPPALSDHRCIWRKKEICGAWGSMRSSNYTPKFHIKTFVQNNYTVIKPGQTRHDYSITSNHLMCLNKFIILFLDTWFYTSKFHIETLYILSPDTWCHKNFVSINLYFFNNLGQARHCKLTNNANIH